MSRASRRLSRNEVIQESGEREVIESSPQVGSRLPAKGAEQNDAEAIALYRTLAEQGDATAQFNLGVMYRTGRGVPQDDVEAYKWYNLAATYADAEQREQFAERRDAAGERLTPELRTDAQRRAREFFAAHPHATGGT